MKRATCCICVIIVLFILSLSLAGGNSECFAGVLFVRIHGKVTYDNYTVFTEATVKFISSSGDTTSTVSDLIGKYELYLSLPSTLVEESSLPEDFILHPNYPNPFNPGTTIESQVSL